MTLTKQYYCYLLASRENGTLYTGVTSDLIGRISVHKQGQQESFTQKYDVNRLVWFECHTDIEAAILREKQIKKWNRDWKRRLIESVNPSWDDLYPSLSQGIVDSRLRGNDKIMMSHENDRDSVDVHNNFFIEEQEIIRELTN